MSKVTSTPAPKTQSSGVADLKKAETTALAALEKQETQTDQDLEGAAKLAPAQKTLIDRAKTQADAQFSTQRSALQSKFNAAIKDLEALNPPATSGKTDPGKPQANKKPTPMTEATALKTLEKNFTAVKDEGKGPAGKNLINKADLEAASTSAKSSASLKQAAKLLAGNSKELAATDTASRGGKADGLISLGDLKAEQAKLAKSSSGGKAGKTGATSGSGINDAKLPAQYRQWAPDILASAKKYGLQPAFVAGIMSRETGGVNERGDGGHGRGLMQIDDRSHGAWLASHDGGMDPKSNIDYGCSILRSNLDTAKKLGLKGDAALKFAASAYNAGVGGAEAGLREGNSDDNTTGHNYGADVLNRMKTFEAGFRPVPPKKTVGGVHKSGGSSGTKGTNAAALAQKYEGQYESQLQRDGVTLPCPTNESCANFVSSMLVKAGASDFRTLGVSDLSKGLQDRGWKKVPLADAKPGDVWICLNAKGAPTEQHTELVDSNKNGKVTLIGSNNYPVDANQQINKDTYSANIKGTYILAPP